MRGVGEGAKLGLRECQHQVSTVFTRVSAPGQYRIHTCVAPGQYRIHTCVSTRSVPYSHVCSTRSVPYSHVCKSAGGGGAKLELRECQHQVSTVFPRV